MRVWRRDPIHSRGRFRKVACYSCQVFGLGGAALQQVTDGRHIEAAVSASGPGERHEAPPCPVGEAVDGHSECAGRRPEGHERSKGLRLERRCVWREFAAEECEEGGDGPLGFGVPEEGVRSPPSWGCGFHEADDREGGEQAIGRHAVKASGFPDRACSRAFLCDEEGVEDGGGFGVHAVGIGWRIPEGNPPLGDSTFRRKDPSVMMNCALVLSVGAAAALVPTTFAVAPTFTPERRPETPAFYGRWEFWIAAPVAAAIVFVLVALGIRLLRA